MCNFHVTLATLRESCWLTLGTHWSACPLIAGFLTTTCGAKLPTKLTPLRTLPAVDVLRGSEGALPNGCASVSFSAGVVGLAGLLAQEPRVVLEVWHKEK